MVIWLYSVTILVQARVTTRWVFVSYGVGTNSFFITSSDG